MHQPKPQELALFIYCRISSLIIMVPAMKAPARVTRSTVRTVPVVPGMVTDSVPGYGAIVATSMGNVALEKDSVASMPANGAIARDQSWYRAIHRG